MKVWVLYGSVSGRSIYNYYDIFFNGSKIIQSLFSKSCILMKKKALLAIRKKVILK